MTTYSQNEQRKIDRLLQQVKVCKVDTTKVNLYFQITNLYFGLDFTKTKPYSAIIYKLSKNNNFQTGIAHYYYNCSVQNSYVGENEKSLNFAKIAAGLYKKESKTDNFLTCQYIVAQSLYKLNRIDEAIAIGQLHTQKDYNGKYLNPLSKMYYLLGCIFKEKIDYKKSILNIEKALQLFIKLNNTLGEYCCYNEKIITLMMTNQYENAKSLSDKTIKAISTTELATLNNAIYENLLANNAKIHMDCGDFEKAKILTIKNIKILAKSENKIMLSMLYNQLAAIEIEFKNYTKAENDVKKAMKISNNEEIIQTSLHYITKINIEQNYFVSAKKNSLALLEKVKQSGNLQSYYDVYNLLAESEKGLGNYKKALVYKQRYIVLNDSFTKIFNDSELKTLQTKFAVEEKDLKLQKYEIEKQRNQLTIKNQLILICSILFFLFFIIFTIYQIKKRNKKLVISEKKLQDTVEVKNVLIKEVHHRVKNNHQMVISLLLLQAKKSNFTTIDNFINDAQHRIDAMTIVHENLYQSENLDAIPISKYLQLLTQNISKINANENIKLVYNPIEIDFFLTVQQTVAVGLIVNELIINALKHAFKIKIIGEVAISFEADDAHYVLKVRDNGCGMPENYVQKKMGLSLVAILSAQLGGVLEQTNQNGLQMLINFPKNNLNEW